MKLEAYGLVHGMLLAMAIVVCALAGWVVFLIVEWMMR